MGRPVPRISALRSRFRSSEPEENSFWSDFIQRIRHGKVIPILSNSLRNDWIFGGPPGSTSPESAGDEPRLTVDQTLAELWAESLSYPMRNRSDLSRVAQYNLVSKSYDSEHAKTRYLTFLKEVLLGLAEQDGKPEDLLTELRGQIHELSFAELASELEYPRLNPGQEDPLRILARLPLPIYITTSAYDFLERALLAEGRRPRTQVCFWSGEVAGVRPEHRPDPAFLPDASHPVVYHLHGLECYPGTLVLSEDDYLNFLTAVVRDTEQENPVIPLYLRAALNEYSLILMGYALDGWDFRVLFRGAIRPQETSLRAFSLVIQLDPQQQADILNSDEARNYLLAYFKSSKFRVEWGEAGAFVSKIWSEWNRVRQGDR